ncbi:tRNA-(ms[2]io[6]A)-hydroxylase [Halieaceae bacterium IMCC14734]|uniref:tRNA-(Ms[2]io[6]A)-hydroxylase n=1 Tax=Candidatus Litorirhabdus singularis TaxID=2518993 RepID=A0ABT3THH3_9GAMM|nr:tRNA isopentenyl-2-thiomethyl-A-37 hydroxylase MiaE [Candidatus Litorirhabdus singularis]MCX2981660.1 tRNA-(ms[2]io[6]A)-hydroxylase [Candidatus Litorirhabdus singularis]
MSAIADIEAFLPCVTPQAWVEWALEHPEWLLIDHANCEHAAAQSALTIMKRYRSGIPGIADTVRSHADSDQKSPAHLQYRRIDQPRLLQKMSRLAREELRHFEQVAALMQQRSITYKALSAGRYAAELRQLVRSPEPARLVDTLLVGAVIEARSCERFARLAPRLDSELSEFYGSLLKSESRHFLDYLALAEALAGPEEIAGRLLLIKHREQELIESPDTEFRFHSGVPAAGATSQN